MADRAAARRYGEAFVGVLEKSQRVEAGLEELKFAARAYEGSKEFQRFLGSPEIGEEEKRSLLDRTFSSAVGPETMALMELVLKWGRADHLPVIAEEAVKVSEERRGILRGVVTTAHPISSAETDRLAQAVGDRLGKRVVLERQVDRNLIGGIRIAVGTTLLDGSVQGILQKIQQQMIETKVA